MDKSLAERFALAAFQDARSEILQRLSMREKIVEVYIVSSISLLGAFLVAARLLDDFPNEVYIVAPVLSLSMSLLIKSHYVAMEKLSEFIRTDLNQTFVFLRGWVPYWDFYNRYQVQGPGTRLDKSRSRWIAHICAIHFPTTISMTFFGFSVFSCSCGLANATNRTPTFEQVVFGLAILVFVWAIHCTTSMINVRDQSNTSPVQLPHWASKLLSNSKQNAAD